MGSSSKRWRDGIAIVGMSARYPGCRSVDEYWTKLVAGTDLLTTPTDDELREVGIDPAFADAMHVVRKGTRLEDGESFDAKFFDISRREAEGLDPQQRILLETAYEALEHAGMTGDGARVGVFAGVGMNTYMLQLLKNPEMLQAVGGYQLMLGNDKDYAATRIAYKLNLRGPAVVVQTACSTSLVAVHLACKSLLDGECDAALAGGVSVAYPQVPGYVFIPGMIMSPDGVCRPFDENAHGTVPGRGAGLVVLKRLADAEADGDTIYAVIGGSAWNNDGSGKVGFTAPSVEGQAEVIRGAQAAAGVSAASIGYVEAHGTGTELGDPIEVAALTEVFGALAAGAGRCVLGAVKANMGHADVAAGVGGLIKAALSVYHGVIPPTPHFERPNPALMLDETSFKVSAEAEAWPVGRGEAGVRWAGVSSFGIGGTNAHVCLRSAPDASVKDEAGPWVFPVSAKTSGALEASVGRLAEFVTERGDVSLSAMAATLQTGRRGFAHRFAAVAGSRDELAAALDKAVGDGVAGAGESAADVAFLFPGQGLQFAGMAGGLFARDTRFRELVEAGLVCLPDGLAGQVRDAICGGAPESGAMPTSLAQPLLYLLEYALAARWIELGVVPGVLLGHSLGELTAAAVAGVFSFEDGLRLAVERGRLMQATPAGAMLAVSLSAEEVSRYLAADLWIAAENAPKLTVISGSVDSIGELEGRLAAGRVASVRLATDRAFHSPDMAEAAARFAEAVEAVERKAPRLRWLSNVTGTWITAEEAVSAQYWAEQMTSRVRFAENAALIANPGGKRRYFLLEVGPGDALIALVRQHDRKGIKSDRTASSLGGVKRADDDLRAFVEAAAKLWEHGQGIRWEGLPGFGGSRRVALPTYPFERERFWVEATAGLPGVGSAAGGASAAQLKRADIDSWFYAPVMRRTPQAAVIQPAVAERVGNWVVATGELGSQRFVEQLIAGLATGGARVLRLPDGSREELEAFWKSQRDADANAGAWGLLVYRDSTAGARDATAAGDEYGWLLDILQSAVRGRVKFAQVELVAAGLVEVAGERVDGTRRATLDGLVRMLPAEFAGVRSRVIDADGESLTELLAELGTVSEYAATVALRAGVRWQQEWRPVALQAGRESKFRVGGTYLITGGVGGIGFLLARHLLKQYGANVALLGRTVLPHRERWEEWVTEQGQGDATSQRIERVKELETLGGSLMLLAADVADADAMAGAWSAIEGRFGAIKGVIHAAGVASGDRVTGQTRASAEAVLRPKVEGSEVLAQLMVGKSADFLLFCSSISAVHPVAGAIAYAAANSFQDRYAVWCRQHLGLPVISVNLDRWADVGMASHLEGPDEFKEIKNALDAVAFLPDEGIEVLERILASGEARILTTTVDLDWVFAERAAYLRSGGGLMGFGQPAGAADGATIAGGDGASAETQAVAAIWMELLGTDRVEPEDNFFELGGHSLLGTMVLARVRERFGIELGIRAIFEYPTPESLGARIRDAGGDVLRSQAVSAVEEREEFEF